MNVALKVSNKINSVASTLIGFGMLVGVGIATAPAQAFTLADVINNGNSITIGDKVFSNFIYGGNGVIADDASKVTFTPFVNGQESGFSLFGQFWATTSSPVVGLLYDVESLNPIVGAKFSVGGIRPGTNFLGSEQLTAPDGTLVADLEVSPGDLIDTATFSPTTELSVFKGIPIFTGSLTGVTIITQTYTAVPEPLTMLGVGASVAFGTFFKKKLAKK